MEELLRESSLYIERNIQIKPTSRLASYIPIYHNLRLYLFTNFSIYHSIFQPLPLYLGVAEEWTKNRRSD